jgi:glycerol-3-phosphate acyltransferase PlsX
LIRIVLDAIGGDHAPRAVLEGALQAVAKDYVTKEQLILAGPAATIAAELDKLGQPRDAFPVLDAPDIVGDESPVEAMRRKPNNSIALGIAEVKKGKAQAFVSAGSTGGVVAVATLMLGMLEGIRRPGIGVTIEGERGPFIVIDVGANPQPKPQHMVHYALMGEAYARDTYGIADPRVGLMNIGTEDAKGNPLAKETSALLKDAPLTFVGNIEGVDVFNGACDVVVCDGFTGNVLLKVSEGVAEYLVRTIVKLMDEAGVGRKERDAVLQRLLPRVDYSEYGGALLLGVNGIVTICHGRSQAPAIRNAIRFANQAVGAKVNQHIVAAAKKLGESKPA